MICMDTTTAAIVAVLGTVALVGLVIALVRTVARDGLGHRPPPAARPDWAAGTAVEIERSTQVHA
jgi:hypothetical protein